MVVQESRLKETILVVDDTPNNLQLLLRALTVEGYEVRCARSGKVAISGAQAMLPDLILLDILMPQMDGYEVCQQLRQHTQTREVPIIFLSVLEDGADKVKAFALGGNDYVAKPFNIEDILARIKYQLNRKQQRRALQQEAQYYQRCNQQLQAAHTFLMEVVDSLVEGVGVFHAVRNEHGQIIDFTQQLTNATFHQLIQQNAKGLTEDTLLGLTAHLEDCDLLNLCVEVVEANASIRRELCCHQGDTQHWVEVFATRLRDGIVTSLRDISAAKEKMATLESDNQALFTLATIDSLTQVANRYSFDAYLQTEWQRLIREQQPLSLLMCDIDKFKRYNDLCGHSVGDQCLHTVAQAIQSVIRRPADLLARYGGEEFAIGLPNTPLRGAIRIAKAIQTTVRGLHLTDVPAAECQQVRLSIGIACTLPQAGQKVQTLVDATDRALHRAKSLGGDTHCVEMI